MLLLFCFLFCFLWGFFFFAWKNQTSQHLSNPSAARQDPHLFHRWPIGLILLLSVRLHAYALHIIWLSHFYTDFKDLHIPLEENETRMNPRTWTTPIIVRNDSCGRQIDVYFYLASLADVAYYMVVLHSDTGQEFKVHNDVGLDYIC